MSASRNADADANNNGEFGSHIPRDEPMTTHGVSGPSHPSSRTLTNLPMQQHKPGVLVGNDAVPEFHAKTLPAGSAPKDRTFAPNSTAETPGQANNDLTERSHGKESTKTSASDTLGGATSGDVHTGMGYPGQGQTSTELRHDGGHTSSKKGGGLMGVGASGQPSGNQMVDTDTQPEQRAVDKEEGVNAGKRGDKGERYPNPPAEERIPESA